MARYSDKSVACRTSPTAKREGRGHHVARRIERQDRAAIADGGERKHGAGADAEQHRAMTARHDRAGAHGHEDDAGGRNQDRGCDRHRDLVAEKNEAEQGDLHRLGLDVGDGDDEGALVHGGEHERGGEDLRQRADENPGHIDRIGRGQRDAACRRDEGQKNQRKGKAEQKARVRRADGAERAGEFALGGVAQRLGEGGGDGEDRPEPSFSSKHDARAQAITIRFSAAIM
jgi:hypothetical protein